MDNATIKTVGQTIANETQIGGNTAARVGGVIEGIGVAFDNKDALIGYYSCTVSSTTLAVTAPNFVLPSNGGVIRIKMSAVALGASTLNINSTGAKDLYYNGAALSASNSWEANEVISVYYDGTRYQASNSQGGGGKAEKIKYNNSLSGIIATDVQNAIDELLVIDKNSTKKIDVDIANLPLLDNWISGTTAEEISNAGSKHISIGLSGYKSIEIVSGSNDTYFTWASSVDGNNWTSLDGVRRSITANNVLSLNIPVGANYIIVGIKSSTNSVLYTPYSITITGGVVSVTENIKTKEVDVESLSVQIGYPSASGTWTIDTSNYDRYHRVLKRDAKVDKIKVDATINNNARFAFVTSYTRPTEGLSCNFCNNKPAIDVPAGSSSGWINIPQNCAYIIIIEENNNHNLMPDSVFVNMFDNCVEVDELCELLYSTDFTLGSISGIDGGDVTSPVRWRSEYIPIKKGDHIHINFNEQHVRIVWYEQDKTRRSDELWVHDQNFICQKDGFVRFCLGGKNTHELVLDPNTMANIYLPLRNDIIKLNDGGNLVPTIKRPPRLNNVVQGDVLTLVHCSDFHIDREFELARLIRFKNEYPSFIDDILCTGDLQNADFSSGISWFLNVNGHENVLQVIGNHDAYKANSFDVNGNQVNVYNRFIAPFVSNWGVVQPSNASTNGYNYWYKDYQSYNIRLIAVDCIYWDATQNTWLQNVLASVPNGYSVVCASHYKPAITSIDCNMDDLLLQPSTMAGELNSDAVDSVQSFINNNGKFICWLCGHEHKDYVGVTSRIGTSQLVIGVACASMVESRVLYGTIERVEGMKSQDLFNIMGFDLYNKHIRILRIGADFDCYMRSKKGFCINYETRQIVSES